jgi:hypothetical protein
MSIHSLEISIFTLSSPPRHQDRQGHKHRLLQKFRQNEHKYQHFGVLGNHLCIDFTLFCLLRKGCLSSLAVTFPETVEEARIEPRTAPLLRWFPVDWTYWATTNTFLATTSPFLNNHIPFLSPHIRVGRYWNYSKRTPEICWIPCQSKENDNNKIVWPSDRLSVWPQRLGSYYTVHYL